MDCLGRAFWVKAAIAHAPQLINRCLNNCVALIPFGLEFDERWVTPESGKRYKQRRINQQSWDRAWQYVRYKESLKAQPETEAVVSAQIADHPPVAFFSEAKRGGDQIAAPQPSVSAHSSPIKNAGELRL